MATTTTMILSIARTATARAIDRHDEDRSGTGTNFTLRLVLGKGTFRLNAPSQHEHTDRGRHLPIAGPSLEVRCMNLAQKR